MKFPPRGLKLRTLLIAVAALCVVLVVAREAFLWRATRGFVEFHAGRASWLRAQGERHADRPDVAESYVRFAAWHDERAEVYRRARTDWLSDEMKEDFRQTEREQDFEAAAGTRPGAPAATNRAN